MFYQKKIGSGSLKKNRQPEHVIVVGAGIAGAATASELAVRGVRVTVLDAAKAPASAASGNRQGLLYAKISPHPTPQTELLYVVMVTLNAC